MCNGTCVHLLIRIVCPKPLLSQPNQLTLLSIDQNMQDEAGVSLRESLCITN